MSSKQKPFQDWSSSRSFSLGSSGPEPARRFQCRPTAVSRRLNLQAVGCSTVCVELGWKISMKIKDTRIWKLSIFNNHGCYFSMNCLFLHEIIRSCNKFFCTIVFILVFFELAELNTGDIKKFPITCPADCIGWLFTCEIKVLILPAVMLSGILLAKSWLYLGFFLTQV